VSVFPAFFTPFFPVPIRRPAPVVAVLRFAFDHDEAWKEERKLDRFPNDFADAIVGEDRRGADTTDSEG
jgi:hypothetical protein